ncbi:cobaltochelatase subunit CobN [Hassallia byssoidea VB512170]|uniref:Cobaltochelatase subunit CobN n=1 Tax=Hassallia byssoidea VB512170 TaxID=1304833 RepID=A0A846HKA0_9CYAN|nr:cobaltochelatase subunit CobN [Hassalia byssoidea]NEU76984.1 cobaltochelatase subunit CobN [Hassalia byssoidea VB512170]
MHRINATSIGWNNSEGVVFFEQTPAPLVFITAADTDIQTLAAAFPKLPSTFPALRVANLLQLQNQINIDTYAEQVLEFAQVIILRLLGGRSYWSYGLEVVQEIVQRNGTTLIVMPGDDALDADLITFSTLSVTAVNQVWQYFREGGVENIVNALKYITDICLSTSFNPPSPQVVPRVGLYRGEWGVGSGEWGQEDKGDKEDKEDKKRIIETPYSLLPTPYSPLPKVGIIFYRAHYLAGNTKVIDALCEALAKRNLKPVPLFVSSLRDRDVQAELIEFFQPKDSEQVALLLNTTSFSLAQLDTETPQLELWQKLDVPVLQVILSGGSVEQWESQFQGLSPRDMAMNVALPEVDGRIISRAVSFKAVQTRNPNLETDVVVYEAIASRIEFVADLAANWVRLRLTPPEERHVALILANYPTRDGRIANGVGLDTPASCVEILKALQSAGYHVENLPADGDELIQRLTSGVTNDPEGKEWRPVQQSVCVGEYAEYFAGLPEGVRQGVGERWGFETNRRGTESAEEENKRENNSFPPSPYPPQRESQSHARCYNGGNPRNALAPQRGEPAHGAGLTISPSFPIPGIQFGNIFVGVQPARGYDIDPSLNYHAPDLEPSHAYLAFYYWVRTCFAADAVVHVGKHGNLEWLPGKSVALSDSCYPEVALGALPHLYPFIVNDPGEGSQAKRRAQAVIIDHLTPPMTRAELYGSLQQLENLIDEYYEAESLDPSRLPTICDRITQLILQENLHQDLKMGNGESVMGNSQNQLPIPNSLLPINHLDGYLCELKEAQIRDGLHIFGRCPDGRQLRDLIVAIARTPNRHHIGFTRAIALYLGLDFDPLTADLGKEFFLTQRRKDAKDEFNFASSHGSRYNGGNPRNALPRLCVRLNSCRTAGDVVEVLEEYAAELVEELIAPHYSQLPTPNSPLPPVLNWIQSRLLPALQQTHEEIVYLLHGLDGGYVPSAPAGAPTRGRPEVLPTGKNFYSIDIRAIPTETAWDIGRKAAETLIECYTQENGEYPKTLALSVWGTATMRTGGDDIAEALALLGVQPVWDGMARRVVDLEILPLSVLGRPRVDVTLRISGFFRDAFPNLIDLFDTAVQAVAALDEPIAQNPLAAQVQEETDFWIAEGLTTEEAQVRSRYRIFGSKPGAYGAGLQGLIESQNWTDDEDLARAYINWSCYAYSSRQGGQGGQGRQEDKAINNSSLPYRRSSGTSLPNSPVSNPEAFEQRLKHMQIVLQNQDNREHDLLDSDDYYQFQGGLTAAVRSVQGKNPQTYFGDNSIPANPRVRHLKEEIARVYRSRVVNPKWIAGMMRHGYKGAFEMAATVDYLFAYDATAKCVEDHMYQGIVDAYLGDRTVCEFIQEKNPWALRDIAERMLEAHKRGLWQDVNIQTMENLRNLVHQAEAAIEEK